MRSRIVQLLVVPLLAGAMLLTGTNAAEAASATNPTRSAVEARAIEAGKTVTRSLQASGTAVFTGADGKVHRMSLSADGLTIDGQSVTVARSSVKGPDAIAAGWWCDIKVAAAVTAIAALSVAFIGWMIAGVAFGSLVTIAGVTLTAGQWTTVMAIGTGSTILANFLRTVLC